MQSLLESLFDSHALAARTATAVSKNVGYAGAGLLSCLMLRSPASKDPPKRQRA
ncbi:MAG: hypothetical protein HC840_10855 [Leptolyngbyaceae cyanobacterium RM2_2_4]|nr:hypothetical protein [Leptolyngbyaceae cyanobacterium SM1_4_3]NJO49849.1 hypothetical protein [Leptolyngbyaceae cyanobacterium RM2_2_4]